jgi:replicative DNA helicase
MQRAALENPEAEIAVLGALIRDADVYWTEQGRLHPWLFVDAMHRDVMKAVVTLAGKGREFGLPALVAHIPARDGDHVGGYLGALVADRTDAGLIPDLIDDLYECWKRREMVAVGEGLIKQATEPSDVSAAERLDKALKRTTDIVALGDGIDRFATGKAVDRVLKRLDAAPDRSRPDGMPWFLPELGRILGGDIEYGWFVGLLADSRGGKTSMALQQSHFTARRGIPVLFLSGDQTTEDCLIQMASQILQIESQAIRKRRLNAADKKLVAQVLGDLKSLPIQFIEMEAPTVKQIARWVQSFVRAFGRPGLVVVDHDDILEANNPRDDLHEKLRQVDRDLKAVIRKTRCGCLYLMQRNAQASQRENPRPTDRDLLGGPRRLKSFDALFYLYREWLWIQQKIRTAPQRSEKEKDALAEMKAEADRLETVAEIGGMKTRFGKQGLEAEIRFDGPHTRYWSEVEDRIREAPEMFDAA